MFRDLYPDDVISWPWHPVGIAIVGLGALPLLFGVRHPGIRLAGVFTAWLGLVIISPWLLLIVGVPPAIVVINRRRRRLRSSRLISAERTGTAPELADFVAAYGAAGFRHAGSLTVTTAEGTLPVAIHRLPDLRGWIEIGPTWLEIQHRFGDRSFSTVDHRTMRRPAGHLMQVCATEDVDGRLTVHRRVIARSAGLGYRPQRLDDEQVIAIVLAQAESAYGRMVTAGWRDAVISTYWEERAYQGRIGCKPLADRRRFERTLRGWLAE